MSEPTQDYPLGGSLEPYDIERDKEIIEEVGKPAQKDYKVGDKMLVKVPGCTCQYHDTKKVINESGLIHNRNCPAGK